MRTDTQFIQIQAPASETFAFLSRPENLPLWARGFAQAIRPSGDGWIVSSPQGEVSVRYASDAARGTVDYHLSPAPGVEVVAYSRVMLAGDESVYVFTQQQPPGMPDEVFAAQVATLGRELRLLKGLLEVGSCAT